VKQLVRPLYRAALWALVLAIVGSSLFTFTGTVAAASPNYALTGFALQPASFGGYVPAGVTVDLVSQATGVVYTTTVGSGGRFTFTSGGTGQALQPGTWGLWVPPQKNLTLSGSTLPYAVLPQTQNPAYRYLNATQLSPTGTFSWVLLNVLAIPYNSTLKGTVTSNGVPEAGAQVRLLAPTYNGLVLVANTTATNGSFSLLAPFGTWVLQTTFTQGQTLVNTSVLKVASRTPAPLAISLRNYLVTGFSYLASSPGSPVPNVGNATLFDTTSHAVFSTATPPGGYYALGTYNGSFDVVLSTVGYQTTWFPLSVTGPGRSLQDVNVTPVAPAQLGNYATTLNFSGINVAKGTGNLSVATQVVLGNNSVFPLLPNATVGQLWAQLGLDFNRTLSFSAATELSAVQGWVSSLGPFFPAVQAGTAVNSTTFLNPNATPVLTGWTSSCMTFCGLGTGGNISYAWAQTFALNGTLFKNSSTYTISFNFAHPSSSNVYNYTVVLPTGYVLAADSQAPTNTKLVAAGPNGTWTRFTLVSQPSPSAGGTAKFSIVKSAALVANVNVSVSNFAFSTGNILNSTHGNYTVVVGVGQNVTFSALNSTFPAGTNGTLYKWKFGDGGTATTTKATTNHTYTIPTTTTNYTGNLTVTSSGGLTNWTTFHVWVVSSTPTAGIVTNATKGQTKTVGTSTYLYVNWGTVLQINATGSSVATPNVLSIASYGISGRGFKLSGANFTGASGKGYWAHNYSFQFLGNGAYLSNGSVGGHLVPFLGWQYNITLTVWTGTGQSAKTSLVVLVNDTQKPVPVITLLNSAGKTITATGGVVEGTNGTAWVRFSAANSTDPNNGSIVRYYWHVSASNNSSFNIFFNETKVKPNGTYPGRWFLPLVAAGKYTVNLTVFDRNKNWAYTTQALIVSVNSTTRPILSASAINGPTSLTAGSSYTFWTNVTVSAGAKAVAQNITVAWYTTGPDGTGAHSSIGGAPGSVVFYNYTSPGVVNNKSFATGLVVNLSFNKTIRAVLTWSPSSSGNYMLWANATATNEWTGVVNSSKNPGATSLSISVKPNPTTQLLEYVAVAAVVVVVIFLLVWWYRRPSRRARAGRPGGKSTPERGGKKPADEDEEEEDET